ncbi:T9SS type A sorting domain-containing protein [Halpernia sp.]|uniref:T9SS type A sorting domain-containing protein n=1 Tax=Halpernia sp. TaxID=2782209 RepID=UPI003A904A42
MKKFIFLVLVSIFLNINAQIGGGWDWAFNTGSLGGADIRYMKYSADGSEIAFAGEASAAVYFGGTTYTAPAIGSYPGKINFFGKINSQTGIPTVTHTYQNIPFGFNKVTTDSEGNFYVGAIINTAIPSDLGHGIVVDGLNKILLAKFDPTGDILWAKTIPFDVQGNISSSVFKLSVSPQKNIFLWAQNPNQNTDGKQNFPLFKFDNSGNLLWKKDALNVPNSIGNVQTGYSGDQFIDDNENIYLCVSSTSGFTFDGVSYAVPNTTTNGTFLKINTSGNVVKAQAFNGSINDYQVNKSTGVITFNWAQTKANAAPFNNLPHWLVALGPTYKDYFSGIIAIDKDFNFIKTKDITSVQDNPYALDTNGLRFLALPNGKLLFATKFFKGETVGVGTDYLYNLDPVNATSVIIETDTDWNFSKFITGGKAFRSQPEYITAYNDTYAMTSNFRNSDTQLTLPTTSYGSVTLTGFNAAPDLTTAYGIYSTSPSLRSDIAVVQTKSQNFPKIASTSWLGNSTDWNSATNWSNGVPTNSVKAMFDQATANYPTTFSSPTSGTLEVKSGVSVPIPNSLTLAGGIKNEGTIVLKDAGFFQGFSSKEWKGSGNVNFTGTASYFFYGNSFTNSILLNTDLTSYYDLNIPKITLVSGKLNLNNKTLKINDRSADAISGANSTNFVYGGPIERKINPTGEYDFPLGNSSKNQTATISAKNLVGVDKLTATYTNGAITGTTPNINYGGTTITSALNGGWFSIVPDQQPTGGSYDATLKIQNSTNLGATLGVYTIIKRDNSTSNWAVLGDYNLATQNGSTISVANKNLTSFSDFAIGKGNNDFVLSTKDVSAESLNVFPNPTKNIVNFSGAKNIKLISVFDASGKQIQVRNSLFNNSQIDLSNYNPGVYYLKIQLENGTSITKKIIKN